MKLVREVTTILHFLPTGTVKVTVPD